VGPAELDLERVVRQDVETGSSPMPVSKTTPAGQTRAAEPLHPPLRVVGLFAGIGGIEAGLHRAGHSSELLCEIEDAAAAVLGARFPSVPLTREVLTLDGLPECDLVAAGFPCQDLSQAGRTAGIGGRNSGLVKRVFELLEQAERQPRWLLLENVPFMLQLERGDAMRFLARKLGKLGYRWAYRVVDARAFGLPQRRQRVILLASQTADPREILFHGDRGEPETPDYRGRACGFYWTEGIRGLGWAVDGVPTLKGGSTIGIPSPPAIWMPDGRIVTPDIRDAERLQGFEADWTAPAGELGRRGERHRWKLVGNAVSVPVAEWVGRRLRNPRPYDESLHEKLPQKSPWPRAAWGDESGVYRVAVSAWPVRAQYQSLAGFLRFSAKPLSERAAAGFLHRTAESTLRFPAGLLEAVEAHLQQMRDEAAA
jgi:DNA (cytosine-5)-methyltransferase 1